MNTKLIGGGAAVGAVLAAWVAGGYYASTRIEADLKAFAARPSAETGLRILNLRHDSGLFSSTGSLQVQPLIQDPQIAAKDIPTAELTYNLSTFLLPTSIARVNWSLKPQGEADAFLTNLFGTHLQIQGAGAINYGGRIGTSFSLPEMLTNQDGVRVSVTPSSGRLTMDKSSLTFGWTLDKITARGSGEALELSKLAVDIDLKDRMQGLGSTTLTFDALSTSSGSAEGFRHFTDVTRNGERMDIRSSDTLRISNFAGQSVSNLALELAMTGLDAASLQDVANIISESNALQELTADEDARFRKSLRTLIARGFSVGISKLSGNLDKGSFTGGLTVDLTKSSSPTAPVALAAQLRSSGELTIKGAAMPPAQAQMAVAMGFAQGLPDGLKASYDYTDGTLRANGRIFDARQVHATLKEVDKAINQYLGTPNATQSIGQNNSVEAPAPYIALPTEPASANAAGPLVSEPAAAPAAPAAPAAAAPAAAAASPQPVTNPSECSEIEQCVAVTLQAAAREDVALIRAVASRVEAMPKPDLGNKAVSRKLNNDGLDALKRNDPNAAAEFFAKGLAENPRDVELAGNLGFALIKADQPQIAAEVLTGTVLLDPRRAATWTPLGEALALSGKPEEAVAALWVAYQWSSNREKTLAFFGERAVKEQAVRPVLANMYQTAQAWTSEGMRPRLQRLRGE